MISRFDGMYEQLVEITTPSGAMETFITRPQDGGPFGPVILYMDIWGVREELYDIARKVARSATAVSCPISITARAAYDMRSTTTTAG
jgi:carboxymethylenebutenolidase